MIAGGAYTPPSPWLNAIREKISEETSEFVRIINDRNFVKYFGKIQGEKLKTAPKGYPSDHPYIEFLKMKSFLALNEVADARVVEPGFFGHVVNAFRAMKPFNDFLSTF